MTLTTKDAETLAEDLRGHTLEWSAWSVGYGCSCGERIAATDRDDAQAKHAAHVAQALIASGAVRREAEDEARGAARVREAVEALADEYDERSRDTEDSERYPWGVAADDLRAVLDVAEKAAGGGVAVSTSEREAGNGPDHAGRSERPADRRTAAQEGICGAPFGDGYTCDLPKGHE